MAFVKLDCQILDSTLWPDRPARDVFVTALLMAEPRELTEPMKQLNVRDLEETGFVVPPGWYGFVPAAGIGIVRRAGLDTEGGLSALERLGAADPESRSPDFHGRRLVRVDGGYIVLNFVRYRERDHTTAERSRRYRERKFGHGSHTVITPRHTVTSRDVTQAEAEAEEDKNKPLAGSIPPEKKRSTMVSGEEFLQKLRTSPAYTHVNVDGELAKMDLWLARHPGRRKTPRFILTWLNKIEAPVGPVTPPRIIHEG